MITKKKWLNNSGPYFNNYSGIQTKSSYKNILLLLFCFFSLLGLGLMNLYSAGMGTTFFTQQAKHALIGLFSMAICGWVIPLRTFNAYSYLFFLVVAICLIVVTVLGHAAMGGQRWFVLGPVRFQPSEMAKLAIVLLTSRFFYSYRGIPFFTLNDLWPILLAGFFVFGIIFEQPDFGTAGVCLLLMFAQLAFLNIRINHKTIIVLGSTILVALVVCWMFFLREYQKLRVLNLFNPSLDPSGSGYNALQSLVAIGSGRVLGKGFLQGTQSQLQFLPARHTDFIFAVFAEEHGFWLSAVVFVLFGLITYIALEIARNARDIFGALVSVGIAALFFIEYSINLLMVIGLFPVVGMPLPFFSYGGSSLVTVCTAIGLLICVERDQFMR